MKRSRVVVAAICLLLSLPLWAACRGGEQSQGHDKTGLPATAPATQPAQVWNLQQVKLDDADHRWKESAKPGVVQVGAGYLMDPATYVYPTVRSNYLPVGDGGLVGCFGTPFSLESSFEIISFGRVGSDIRLQFRHRPTGGHPIAGAEFKYLFFSATLPPDLPDGHYTITCTMLESDGPAKPPVVLTGTLIRPAPPPPTDPLNQLSDRDLVARYVARGTDLKGWAVQPMDREGSLSGLEMEGTKYMLWLATRSEILSRGAPVVPLLIDLLKKEVPRNAGVDADHEYSFGFARDLMELLAQIGDPRAAPTLVDVLDGFGDKANAALREAALPSLERLTYVTFRDGYADENTLPHQALVPLPPQEDNLVDGPARRSAYAASYRRWMASEGKDTSQWLEMALEHARAMLNGRKIDQALVGFEFLRGEIPHPTPRDPDAMIARDNHPEQTLARFAQLAGNCTYGPGRNGMNVYRYRGEEVPLGQCIRYLGGFGAPARRYAPLLLQLADDVGYYRQLMDIGGTEIVAHLIEHLPELERKRDALAADKSAKDWERRSAEGAITTCRWCIARWTGRAFPAMSDVQSWWGTNRDKTQAQWLADSLEPTAAKADGGDAESQYLIRQILPDLPHTDADMPYMPVGTLNADFHVKPRVFRTAWLAEHRKAIVYDDNAGRFTLPPATRPS